MNIVAPLPSDLADTLRQAGLRLTPATRAVLQLFASEPGWSATHAEVHERLRQEQIPINRVTLYRLLDRLGGCGVLTRYHNDDERAWRFVWAGGHAQDDWSTRFECDTCHRQFPLREAAEPTRAATEQVLAVLETMGHRGQRVDVSIHGTCAGCDTPDEAHPA